MEYSKTEDILSPSPIELSDSEKEEIQDKISVLIVTATNIETETLHKSFRPLPGYGSIAKMYDGNQTYYIGCFGVYAVIHVQCGSMGSIYRDASITTVMEAIDCWKPKAVVMIGIAFGKDNGKQRIGDVLLSEAVIPYNIQRVGKKKKSYRNPIPPSGGVLLNRFRNFKDWDYTLPCQNKAKVIPCQILSGESLVDNPKYKDELFEAFPGAKGGEMEGAGLYAAADNKKLEWILVKGICDFGDGNKSENKTEYQNIAASSATSFCLKVFSSKHAFKQLGFIPIDSENQGKVASGIVDDPRLVNRILFDVYKKDFEEYYIERSCDHEIRKYLDFCGLWISGPTGCGKTCSIFRNLIQTNRKYIYINLGCCIGCKIEELFNHIYLNLLENVGERIADYKAESSIQEITRNLSMLFRKHFTGKEIFIIVEEIPIEKNDDFGEFVSKISAILITVLERNSDTNVKFILSSINGPKQHIGAFQKKIHEKIKFLNYSYWGSDEIEKLLEMIIHHLKVPFSKPEKQRVIEKSKGSPRFIKMFVRNYISSHKNPFKTVDGIINETLDDLD